MWRRVFALFVAKDPPPAALVVVHDTDGEEERLSGLEQALELMRTELSDPLPIVAATPHPEAEAWFVAGLIPADEKERRRLTELTHDLSFEPTKEPHRLTARPNDASTDAKRVLRLLLFGEDASRPPSSEELPDVCDRVFADLALIEGRGDACRLAAFVGDVRIRLVPILVPGARGARRG